MVSAAKLNEAVQEREELASLFVRVVRTHNRWTQKLGPRVLSRLLAAVPAKHKRYSEGVLNAPRTRLSSPVTGNLTGRSQQSAP